MSRNSDPNVWNVTSTNPGSDDARTVEGSNGEQGEVTWNGDVGDVRNADGDSIGTIERD